MAEGLIQVTTHPSQGERVGIWDVSPEHPDGEVFVAGQGKVFEVFPTAAVQIAIRENRIMEVGGHEARRLAAENKAAEEPEARGPGRPRSGG